METGIKDKKALNFSSSPPEVNVWPTSPPFCPSGENIRQTSLSTYTEVEGWPISPPYSIPEDVLSTLPSSTPPDVERCPVSPSTCPPEIRALNSPLPSLPEEIHSISPSSSPPEVNVWPISPSTSPLKVRVPSSPISSLPGEMQPISPSSSPPEVDVYPISPPSFDSDVRLKFGSPFSLKQEVGGSQSLSLLKVDVRPNSPSSSTPEATSPARNSDFIPLKPKRSWQETIVNQGSSFESPKRMKNKENIELIRMKTSLISVHDQKQNYLSEGESGDDNGDIRDVLLVDDSNNNNKSMDTTFESQEKINILINNTEESEDLFPMEMCEKVKMVEIIDLIPRDEIVIKGLTVKNNRESEMDSQLLTSSLERKCVRITETLDTFENINVKEHKEECYDQLEIEICEQKENGHVINKEVKSEIQEQVEAMDLSLSRHSLVENNDQIIIDRNSSKCMVTVRGSKENKIVINNEKEKSGIADTVEQIEVIDLTLDDDEKYDVLKENIVLRNENNHCNIRNEVGEGYDQFRTPSFGDDIHLTNENHDDIFSDPWHLFENNDTYRPTEISHNNDRYDVFLDPLHLFENNTDSPINISHNNEVTLNNSSVSMTEEISNENMVIYEEFLQNNTFNDVNADSSSVQNTTSVVESPIPNIPNATSDNSTANMNMSKMSKPNQTARNEAASRVDIEDLWLTKSKTKAMKHAVVTKNEHDPIEVNDQDEEDHESDQEDDYGVKETFSDYCPPYIKIGKKHPASIVESSSLAAVLPPPVTYGLHLPDIVVTQGLSSLQLEAVTYASQQHQITMPSGRRAGFFIGDGAGVGKGRTIAGLIMENWICGRKKGVWISASPDLFEDARRDLDDIGAQYIPLNRLTDKSYHTSLKGDGVIFSTFHGLIMKKASSQGIKYSNRMEQLMDWMGSVDEYEGLIIFDECHKAKNLYPSCKGAKPTEIGKAVNSLQNSYPKARIIYSSATGATEPRHMAYMDRLGIWGQNLNFENFTDFLSKVERRGMGGMEQVAMDLKLRGMYVARQLGFRGVQFDIVEVKLTDNFIEMYDESVAIWKDLRELFKRYPEKMRAFWGAQQRFFKYLSLSSKVDEVVKLCEEAVRDGNCVVIGLQSTGEASTEKEMKENSGQASTENGMKEHSDEVSTEKGNKWNSIVSFASASSEGLQKMVKNELPCSIHKTNCDLNECSEKKEIWSRVVSLCQKLPENVLDVLVDKLGGPNIVAEMTGRSKRLIKDPEKGFTYSPVEKREVEKEHFQSGTKLIGIISQAASTGISLHADNRASNQRRRIHITIELPWSADSAIQQFGRTHRSNQAVPPKYVFVISGLQGEKRFAATVAKRLESLGALTHGDRRSTQTRDFSSFNFFTKDAREALNNIVLTVSEDSDIKMPKPPSEFKNKTEFFDWMNERFQDTAMLDKKSLDITKFMNRLLGMKVKDQNTIFSYFVAAMESIIVSAKREGRYDQGIMDIIGQDKANLIKTDSFDIRHATGTSKAHIHQFSINRGLNFESARVLNDESKLKNEGFWLSQNTQRKLSILVKTIKDGANHGKQSKYRIYRPNTGETFKTMSYSDLSRKYRKVTPGEAQAAWEEQFKASQEKCSHAYKSEAGLCNVQKEGGSCEDGKRIQNYTVISGSILSVWHEIEEALSHCNSRKLKKVQMVRINNGDNRIIGINIPNQVKHLLIEKLASLQNENMHL